jgi:hypothetical protein
MGYRYSVITDKVDSGFGHQGNQPGYKIQRLKYDVRSAVTPGRFQLIAHPAVSGH